MQPKRISLFFALLLAVLAGTPVAQAASTCLANVPVSTPTSDFTLNGDGTVTHLKTGLMWKQCMEGQWGASCAGGAASYAGWNLAQSAAATPFAGYSDWRVPNKKELQSIVETACASPSVNETVFPNAASLVWSSTMYASYAAIPPGPNFRWMVEFSNGASSVSGGGGVDASNGAVRLVRSGQPMDSYPVLLKTNQTIAFGVAPTVVFGSAGTVSASGGASGNAVTFTSTTTGVCTISGSIVTGVTVGTCTIAANQAGNGSYNAAPQATQSFSVAKAGQAITFGAAPTVVVGGTGTVSAGGGASGNAVTFTSSTTGVCTVSGSTVTGVATGTCTIAAAQAGNGSYNAAAQAMQSFIVSSAALTSQTISFGVAPTVIVGGTGAVSATGGASGNAVTFTSSTTGVCTISGGIVTGVTAGTCTIAANQAGNGSYNAAPQVTQSFSVGVAAPAATVVPLNDSGQTLCYGATGLAVSCTTVADDGHYGRDAANTAGTLTKTGAGHAGFDFSKIANNGSVLAAGAMLGAAATDWACTRDNITGLTWEVKTTSGLRSSAHVYTWYSTDVASNGGSVGTANGGVCTGSSCDTQSFVAAVNATALCGYSDWRMPSPRELQSLVDLSVLPNGAAPTIDATYFPNTRISYFWTANTGTGLIGAWVVHFDDGASDGWNKANNFFVRLVRGVQ